MNGADGDASSRGKLGGRCRGIFNKWEDSVWNRRTQVVGLGAEDGEHVRSQARAGRARKKGVGLVVVGLGLAAGEPT